MLSDNRPKKYRRIFGLAASSVAAPRLFAQQPRKLWRIGLLYLPLKKFFIDSGNQSSLLLGMREHGYEPGRIGMQIASAASRSRSWTTGHRP